MKFFGLQKTKSLPIKVLQISSSGRPSRRLSKSPSGIVASLRLHLKKSSSSEGLVSKHRSSKYGIVGVVGVVQASNILQNLLGISKSLRNIVPLSPRGLPTCADHQRRLSASCERCADRRQRLCLRDARRCDRRGGLQVRSVGAKRRLFRRDGPSAVAGCQRPERSGSRCRAEHGRLARSHRQRDLQCPSS